MKSFFIAFLSFAILDFIWLGFIMKTFNMKQLSQIGRIENGVFDMMYAPALLVYILMALAVVVFILPQIQELNLLQTFIKGAFMGLIVYGVFDGTNLAILKNYPLAFAVVDVAWGTFAFGAVTALTQKISGIL